MSNQILCSEGTAISNVISAGSAAVPRAFANVVFWGNNVIMKDLDDLEKKAIDLLNKYGRLDLPLLIEKLKVDSETALNIIKKLRSKGIIISKDEFL